MRTPLRAERKSAATIANYTSPTERLTDYLEAQRMPTDVTKLPASMLRRSSSTSLTPAPPPSRSTDKKPCNSSSAGSTTKERYPIPRWRRCHHRNSTSPRYQFSLEDLRKLLDVCKGTGFEGRRDAALIRLMFDSGARLAEVAGLEVSDLDLRGHKVAHVRGKGGKHRALPMGPKTLKAIDGYMRRRAAHKDAQSPIMWLGGKGRLSGSGIRQMLKRRCREAGIPEIHPHQLSGIHSLTLS